jgi:acylphosphatase
MENNVRARLIISGRVQGVFFRAETKRAVQPIGVCGWVRNKPDGTVEALFEGPEKAVQQAIQWCRKGPPSARVTDVKVVWEDYDAEFDSFQIAFF